ncbi:hypothetical protein BSU01_24315 [Erwinia billingiae]|uniref:MFS transporter n=1 Tax=Erwinia billingiae TaxID=182337 RepID=UPI0019CFDE9E|nr:MFS transporter [Erwinia billingiae]MBN7124795.1 hypothetical protein [Erwinia billingiae]
MLKKTEHKEVKVKVPLFRPLVHPEFRHLCVANFLANIGSWMQIFATGWLVATQTKDPSVSAMAQTLTQIPIFLFSVLGGVMADRYQSYRYLGSVNISMMFSSTLLAGICLLSVPGISIIFIFTFLTASGTALKASAWQATMSSLVAPEEIEAAATLNGLSYNLASIIGPSLGAMLFAVSGAAVLYFTNALCLASLAIIYFRMQRRAPKSSRKIKKNLLALLTDGLRISSSSVKFRGILIVTALIFFSVSTFQAMLPAYVSLLIKGNSHTLGLLMGGFGAGAVIAAFSLSTLRTILVRHQLLSLACGVYGIFLLSFSTGASLSFLVPVAIVGGFAWASIVSTMNSSAQAVFDSSLRARALSVYSMCFYGALTLGSLTWGKISSLYGIQCAFSISGCLMFCTALYVFFASNTRD